MTAARRPPGKSDDVDALAALADREHRAGRLAEAAEAYHKVLALRPDIAEAYNNLGNVLLDQGKLEEAAAQYERASAIKPGLFQAQNNLGNVLRRQGKLEQAAARFAKAITLAPDVAAVHNNLGNVLLDQGKLEEAATQLRRAVALQPDLAEAHNNLGAVLRDQDRIEEALTCFERALALRPNLAEAHNNLGTALKQHGKFDQALASYDKTLALRPDYAESHYYRADLKTFRTGDADLAALEALAGDPQRLPAGKMLFIHFALAKALEDTREYGRAFEHWLQGNALKRREVHYNETANQQTFQAVAAQFNPALFDRLAAAGDPSPATIFIVGMPRSGSTLVEQILASHPQVHAAGELFDLDRVVRSVSDDSGRRVPYPQWVADLDADVCRQMGQSYLAKLPPLSAGQTRITDKAPSNFTYLGLIHLILPNARVIHTTRDPVDTCFSCFATLFIQGQNYSYDLAELGRYYRRYEGLMEHWRRVLPAESLLDVSYEAMVENQAEEARRLIDFCGLPWDERCLSFHETNRSIRTASNVQVRRPLYRSSVARWRHYEAYLQPLLDELRKGREAEDTSQR